MIEGEGTTLDAFSEERAAQNSVLDPPLSSAERWRLRKFEIMEEVSGRLRNYLTLTITVLAVLIALLSGLGYFGMTAYIQSIFRDKIDLETKNFDKLQEA